LVRRRRTNVLFGLVALNGLSLFLAFTTGSTAMVYLFAVAAIALVGYCYTLVQIRNQEYLRRYYGTHRAARRAVPPDKPARRLWSPRTGL
jgi:hypothetical protein